MADSVTVSTVSGAQYTWATASFAWQSADAQKTWATATQNDYTANVSEWWTTSDQVAKAYGLNVAEAFSMVEAIVKNYGLSLAETLSVLENFDRAIAFTLSLSESFSTSDSIAKDIGLPLAESWATVDSFVKNIGLNPQETFQVAEDFGRVVAYQVFINEGLSVTESIAKAYEMPVAEAFKLYDQYRRKANGVISDIKIGVNDITEDDFAAMLKSASAAGYDDFKPFMVGDYTYQKAIFKIALASVNSDRPQVASLNASVDVPDIFDRGSASLGNADVANGLYVKFNRPFNTPPEVTMTLKSVTGGYGIPTIIGPITKDGFTFKILDASNTSIPGTIGWAAHGY